MSEATLDEVRIRRESPFLILLGMLVVSIGAHAGALLVLHFRPPPTLDIQKPIEMVMVEVEPPKPPEPVKEEPEPPKPVVKPRPPPVKVAEVVKPPPVDDAPPPPNDAPPPEEPAKPVPLVVGISMSSTTSAGSFAAPVGNTLYGKTADKAVKPQEVKAYVAPKYTPVYQVDSAPTVAREVKVPYPEAARRAGIEGSVLCSLTIDDEGRVVNVKLLKGLGYGLDEAALEALKQYRFKPAMKGGEAVSTEIKYNYVFLLD